MRQANEIIGCCVVLTGLIGQAVGIDIVRLKEVQAVGEDIHGIDKVIAITTDTVGNNNGRVVT